MSWHRAAIFPAWRGACILERGDAGSAVALPQRAAADHDLACRRSTATERCRSPRSPLPTIDLAEAGLSVNSGAQTSGRFRAPSARS